MKTRNSSKSLIAGAFCLLFTSLPLLALNDADPVEPTESSQPTEPVPEPLQPVCGDWPYCVIEKS